MSVLCPNGGVVTIQVRPSRDEKLEFVITFPPGFAVKNITNGGGLGKYVDLEIRVIEISDKKSRVEGNFKIGPIPSPHATIEIPNSPRDMSGRTVSVNSSVKVSGLPYEFHPTQEWPTAPWNGSPWIVFLAVMDTIAQIANVGNMTFPIPLNA